MYTVLDEIIHDLNLGDNEKLRTSIKMEGSLNKCSQWDQIISDQSNWKLLSTLGRPNPRGRERRQKIRSTTRRGALSVRMQAEINIKLIQIYFVSTVKLAASVPLAPTPCALQLTQRNHDYKAWRVAEGRSYQKDYWSQSRQRLGFMNNE